MIKNFSFILTTLLTKLEGFTDLRKVLPKK